MTSRAPSFFLLLSGFFLFMGHLSYRWAQPFRDHVPFFLVIFSFLFFIYFAVIFWLRKQENDEILRPASLPKNIHWTRNDGLIVFVIFFFSLALRFTLIHQTPSLSDDIYRYVWDGRVQKAGINPYFYPPSSSELDFLKNDDHKLINHPTLRTIYPPLTQYFFRLGVELAPTIFGQKYIFLFFDVVLILMLMWILRLKSISPVWSVIYAWNPLVVIEYSASGHNDSLMMCALMAAFILFEKKKAASGVLMLGLASLTKLIPIVMIPWIILNKNRRFMVLYVLIVGFFCFPFALDAYHLWQTQGWETSGLGTYAKDWVFNPSLYGLFGSFASHPTYRKIFIGLLLIIFAGLWALKTKRNAFLYTFGVVFALLLASPVVHPWYVTWLLPFLCVYPLWSGLLWTWLVGFSYIVLIRFTVEGVWILPGWVMMVEYGVIYGVLVIEILRGWKQKGVGRVWTFLPGTNVKAERKLNVAVIIPALNEEKAIPLVIQEIPKNLVNDIIVVDNGSTDTTPAVARQAGARVINEPHRGYGQAVLTGLNHLKPDCNTVVILDGDHSDFPEDLHELLKPLEAAQADMVIGVRTKAALPGSLMPQQRFGNWLTCLLIRTLYAERFSDMGPFRVIRRQALEQMKMEDKNFGWNVEMQVKALQNGLSIAEVPVRYRPRIGQSKISGTLKGSFKAGVVILWSIYKYGWRGSYY